MKPTHSRHVSLALLFVLGLALIPFRSVVAQSVLSVAPGTIVNNVTNIITVNGTGFDNTAVVLLEGTALATNFVGAETLTATVPAGVAAGSYTITVTMTGATVTGFAILQVNAPTPTPTTAPDPFARPQFVVYTSKLVGTVKTGGDVTLKVVMENVGKSTAYNTQAAFTSSDLVPTKTGGIVVLGTVAYDMEVEASQTFYVSAQITGRGIIVADMTVSYYDSQGTSYSDKFTLSIPVSGGTVSSGGPAAPTATPTGVTSSQLVITGYSASVDTLQPGAQFALNLTVRNVGNANAQRITMIVGGGSGGGGPTPQPGGVSGGGGDFANFAPVGASNVQSLGDLKPGETMQVAQSLIVNVSTNPGAYPMRITFSYLNDKNEVIEDEQVITLLVYSLPNLDASFYRPPDPFFAGQPGALPIQVVNLGRRLAVLGNIKIEAQGGVVENGTSLIGSLDAGGYFTLDAMLIPDQPGTVNLSIVIDYLDDFNQPRTFTDTLEVEVEEGFVGPPIDPSNGGGGDGFPVPGQESAWQKIWRFILGLFGLDSAPSSSGGTDGIQPGEEPVPLPRPAPGEGKG